MIAARLAIGWVAALAVPQLAYGHGAAPAVLGVVRADAAGPQLLQLSKGLAIGGAAGWRYLCSARWVAPLSPSVVAADASTAWIAGEDGFFTLSSDGKIARRKVTGVDPLAVRGLGRAGGRALALVVSKGAGKVLALPEKGDGVAQPVWSETGEWAPGPSSAAAFWIVGDGQQARLRSLSAAGLATAEDLAIEATAASLSLPFVAADGQKLAVSRIFQAKQQLFAVARNSPAKGQPLAAELLLEDYPFVAGPVALGAQWLAVKGGALVTLKGGVASEVDKARFYSCLATVAGTDMAYACARSQLFGVDASGAVGGQSFALQDLKPPDYAGFGDIDRYACFAEWADLANESGIAAGPEPAAPLVSAPPAAGCDARACSEVSLLAVAAVCMVTGAGVAMRRRRTGGRDANVGAG